MKISVIVPVYNLEKYIRQCLESVLNQTYRDLEILAVNDGSKDSSKEILDAYALKDPRITVLDKPNGGLSDARNCGMDHMTGEYVVFIDSDDVIDPDMVGHLLEAAEKTGSDIAVSDMEYFYEDGRTGYSDGGQFTCTNVRETPGLIAINNSACNKLFRSELFLDVRFPKGLWYEDLATIPILLCKAGSVVKVNEALYRYRQRSGSIINMTSVVGISGNAGQCNYAASKAGMIALAQSVAQEMGPKGIRVNTIAPGFIETAMTAALPEEVRQEWAKKIPLRRGGQVEDIANVATFLASDMSSYVTGQVIQVDGGMNM